MAHAQEVVYISHTMGTRGSPDIYTLCPWACGPRASGVYIRQTTRAHGITITYRVHATDKSLKKITACIYGEYVNVLTYSMNV